MLKLHSPNILCTWEMGGNLGHISRLAHITHNLEQKRYNVSCALKDLSKAYSFFSDANTSLLQAPLWLPKINMQRPIACLADVLLLQGYLNEDDLMGPVMAWKTLLNTAKPDLILFDYSPTAMLAAAHLNIPKIMIGTGFSEPVAGEAIADWRPFPTKDELIPRQEARVLDVVNKVLLRTGCSPLEQLSDLFKVDRTILTATPDIDPYQEQRTNARYHILQGNPSGSLPAQFGPSKAPKILTYLKPNHPGLESIIRTLAKHSANVFVSCPNGNEALFQPLRSDSFRYSTGLIAMEQSIAEADLFFGHGNCASTMESLLNGRPCVILPIQLEQLLIGLKVEELGVGVLMKRMESETQLTSLLDQALASNKLREKTTEYASRHHSLTEGTLGDLLARECSELLNRTD